MVGSSLPPIFIHLFIGISIIWTTSILGENPLFLETSIKSMDYSGSGDDKVHKDYITP